MTNIKAVGCYLNNPAGMYMDPSNNLLVADSGNHRIARIIIQTTTGYTKGYIYNVAGKPCQTMQCSFYSTNTYSGDGGDANSANLNNPEGVAADKVTQQRDFFT